MNYTGRYGLEINPFIKNGKDVLVETNEYKEVKFRLNYLLQTKGFGILTGGAGRGKTTSVRQWANRTPSRSRERNPKTGTDNYDIGNQHRRATCLAVLHISEYKKTPCKIFVPCRV